MKHPGPWKRMIDDEWKTITIVDDRMERLIIPSPGVSPFVDKEVERLVLAAPETARQRDELLEALKDIVSVEGEHCIDHEGESCEAAFAKARALIARIEQEGK